jgi:hypothetical protein
MKEHREHFESLADFAAASAKRATDMLVRESSDFNGNVDHAGAVSLARNGWHAGAERVKALADKLMERIAPAVACVGLEHQSGGGSLVDVDRFIAGDPEHFMEFAPIEARRHVTIEVSGITGWKTPAANIERRGAAILAAILALKARGITADVVWSHIATSKRHKTTGATQTCKTTVAVCNGREWLDVESLAFALVHPAMLRQIQFGVQDALPKSWKLGDKSRYGLATAGALTEAQAIVPMQHTGDYSSDSEAIALALKLCADCGARLDGLDN